MIQTVNQEFTAILSLWSTCWLMLWQYSVFLF